MEMTKKDLLDKLVKTLEKIKDPKKKKVITSILKDDNWYLKLDIDMVISILIDLGFNKEESVKIYKFLIVN